MNETHSVGDVRANLREWRRRLLDGFANNISEADLNALRLQDAALATETPSHAEGVSAPVSRARPTLVQTQQQISEMAALLVASDCCAVDLETSDSDARKGVIVGVGFAVDAGVFYTPIAHRDDRGRLLPDQLTLADVLGKVPLAELKLVAHNAKFEFAWLRKHAGVRCNIVWDTMLAARLLRSDLLADLESVAIRELDVPAWSLPKEEMTLMQHLPIDRVAAYCAKDCRYTLDLYRKQSPCLA